jgi:hypothetical protein
MSKIWEEALLPPRGKFLAWGFYKTLGKGASVHIAKVQEGNTVYCPLFFN